MNLVHNATWHDGQQFTANDVAFTINLLLKHPEISYEHEFVQTIASVHVLDNYTVEIQTSKPDATLLDYELVNIPILPQHIWANVANYTSYTGNPVGTGPFKVIKWGGPGTYVQLAANDNYFYGRPHIDQLVFQYFSSSNAMALALESGQIDYAGPTFPNALLSSLSSLGNVQLISRLGPEYYYFCFNGYAQGFGNPALRNKEVRIALSHAIDSQELSQVVWGGFAKPQNTIIPIALGDWVNPNVMQYDFNLTTAANMLDAAGYKVGSDGVRVGPNGTRLALKIEVPSDYAEEYRAAQEIAGWWKQIGVAATPQITDTDTMGGESVNWKFDTYIWVWSTPAGGDPDLFLSVFQSSQAAPAPNPGFSDSGYQNPVYDQLYNQQIQQTNSTLRHAIVYQMQAILHQDEPYYPVYDPYLVQAIRSDMFTGVPAGLLPPVFIGTFYSLLASVRPTVAPAQASQTTTATAAMGTAISTEGLAAIAVVVVVVLAAVGVVVTRRKSSKKGQ
jgi:peptide/nickel transport system substrate-binding protein